MPTPHSAGGEIRAVHVVIVIVNEPLPSLISAKKIFVGRSGADSFHPAAMRLLEFLFRQGASLFEGVEIEGGDPFIGIPQDCEDKPIFGKSIQGVPVQMARIQIIAARKLRSTLLCLGVNPDGTPIQIPEYMIQAEKDYLNIG